TAVSLFITFLLGPSKLMGFLIWMAGCGLVYAYARFELSAKRWLSLYSLASFVAFWACLTAARRSSSSVFASDLAVGLTFTLFLLGIPKLNVGERNHNYIGASRRLAGFSYSLYVLHFPLLLFLRSWIVPAERWQPSETRLFYSTLLGFVVLTFAWVVSLRT